MDEIPSNKNSLKKKKKTINLVVKDSALMRLDRFLRRKFTYLTQGVIEQNLRKGKIKVNNQRVSANIRISEGNVINIDNHLINNNDCDAKREKNNFSPSVISLANKILNEYVIFCCDNFIAINKPINLAAQGGSKITLSIDHALQYLNKTQNSQYRLVHRIDKNTSGVFLIAKNLQSAISLTQAFNKKQVKKTYLAVIVGDTSSLSKQGNITSYIAKVKSGIGEIVQETKDGKYAKTIYEILASDKNLALVKYNPFTGRMHQLRYHSKQIGLPILGDLKYGNSDFKRMMLHALEITIPEEVFGKKYTIKAKLDQSFEFFLQHFDYVIKT